MIALPRPLALFALFAAASAISCARNADESTARRDIATSAPPVVARPSRGGPDDTAPGEPARIAIIGDSISHSGETRGRLGASLRRLMSVDSPAIAVDTHAVPGRTCGRMIERLEPDVLAATSPYDTLIIQCGTNDLYNDLELKRIADDIDTMIEMARGAGLRVVLLTVPPATGDDGWSAARERKRVGLNRWIMGRTGVVSVDAAAVLGVGDPPSLKEAFRFRDWIHPSDAGLDAVAAEIATALSPLFPDSRRGGVGI